MSFQVNLPPSFVAKMAQTEKDITEEESTGKRREDWKKLKELEEARKAGTAPAMQDEEGKDINPHIPQYIMQAPWYIGAVKPTLKHQRMPDEMQKKYDAMNKWYKHGVQEGKVVTKYRDGACENCGAMGHKKKECLERPRKTGARFTNKEIAPDEFEQPVLEFDYDGKRDRWNGYDTNQHKKIVEEFCKLEEAKRLIKAQKMDRSLIEGEADETVTVQNEEEEDDKYADDMAMPGQKFETKQRITVRNLRIREDTAKYLHNLDPESAYYDPKTRSMRQNPFDKIEADMKDLPYAGDNFVRFSGDALNIAKQQMFAWEAYERGSDVHVQADPTKLEFAEREYRKKADEHKNTEKNEILERYGGLEHLEAPPKQLLLAQTENYAEYSRHGTLLKGDEKATVRSQYEEDEYDKNHMAVWGSYWTDGKWGYKCCKSCVRGSYCLGTITLAQLPQAESDEEEEDVEKIESKNDKDKVEELPEVVKVELTSPSLDQPKSLLHQHLEKMQATEKTLKRKDKKKKRKALKKQKKSSKKTTKKRHRKSTSEMSSSSSESLNVDDDDDSSECDEEKSHEKKLKEALEREDKRLKEVSSIMALEERKRPYNVMYDGKGPTPEDIEVFQRKRMRDDDPMARLFNQ